MKDKRNLIIFILSIVGIIVMIPLTMADNPRVLSLDINQNNQTGNTNGIMLYVNVSLNVPGHIKYVEEYYTIDSSSYPVLCCSQIYYSGDLVQINSTNGTFYNATFDIIRPKSNQGKTYQIIKKIVLLNDVRLSETWTTRNQTFIDNTDTDTDNMGEDSNIAAHESREKVLSSSPSTFTYTSLDSIYEINATGKGDTTLRIDIFKDAPITTYLSNGIVYRYINVAPDNLNIDNISFKYKTDISWVQSQSIKTLGLFRWSNDEKRWVGLPTNLLNNDNSYLYFESAYPNSSLSGNNYFAIIGFGPTTPSTPSNRTLVNPVQQVNAAADNSNLINSTINNTINNTNSTKSNDITEPHQYGTKNVTATATAIPPTPVPAQTDPLIKNIPGFEFLLTAIVTLFMYKVMIYKNRYKNKK